MKIKYTVRFKHNIDDDYNLIICYSISRVLDLFRDALYRSRSNSSFYFIVDCSRD